MTGQFPSLYTYPYHRYRGPLNDRTLQCRAIAFNTW